MDLAAGCTEYKSPEYKLLSFFHKSRDRWKAKARARHLRIRRLEKEVAVLRDSRRMWREKARAAGRCHAARAQERDKK
jgi:hypothetical protein